MAVEELAKPSGRTELQFAMRAALGLNPPARECVIAHRDYHARRDFERCKERLTAGTPVELEAVARFHSHVDGRHEVFPRLQNSARIGDSRIFILEKLLAYPAKRTLFGRPWLVGAAHVGLPCSRPGQKPKQRLEA